MQPWFATALSPMDPVFGHAAAAIVASVLAIAALEKLRQPEIFRDNVDNYQILPAVALPWVARGLPLLELMAGLLLLPAATRTAGAALACAHLLLVTLAVVVNLLRGRERIDCGCGGDLHTSLSSGLVLRNAVLVLLTFVAAAPTSARNPVWLDVAAVGCATLFGLGLYYVVNLLLSQQSRLTDLRNSP
ncbi:MAG: MauE/DoxX family redox-associated membrane protein [Betaproteobacteria bacterium]